MKNPVNHQNKIRIFYSVIGILVFGSITALFAITRISPPPHNVEQLLLYLFIITIVLHAIGMVVALTRIARVFPPRPNPHKNKLYIDAFSTNPVLDISIGSPVNETRITTKQNYQTHKTLELNYYSPSPATKGNMAYMIGPNSEVLDSASVVSSEMAVSFKNSNYYPKRVVFQLKENLNSPIVKVTIHDELFIPEGEKEFHIMFE